jgi:hypothetical protein
VQLFSVAKKLLAFFVLEPDQENASADFASSGNGCCRFAKRAVQTVALELLQSAKRFPYMNLLPGAEEQRADEQQREEAEQRNAAAEARRRKRPEQKNLETYARKLRRQFLSQALSRVSVRIEGLAEGA